MAIIYQLCVTIFGQMGAWRWVSTKQEKFSVPTLQLASGPARQTQSDTLPAHLGGRFITKQPWCGDSIISSDGFSCCVCNTCSSLAVLLEWACTPAYQPVVLFLSVTLYWSLPSVTTKSKLYIKDTTLWAAVRWQSLDFRPAVCPKDLHISVCILFLEVLCIFLFVVERI